MKERFIGQDRRNLKVILSMAGIIVILLFAMLILNVISKNMNRELSYDNLTTIKEVIEYYESRYISEKESEDNAYYLDVNVVLAKLPYDEKNNSNEEYYTNLLEDSAKVLNYNSFRLLDKENDLKIEVVCDGRKIVRILINGIEDYFIYYDSLHSMEKFKEIEKIDLEVNSEALQACISNDWKSDTYLGERESICDNYTVYFDEGYKAKYIKGQIYNLVFTKNYEGKVVSNLSPSMSNSDIKEVLGKPAFENEDLSLIGYKSDRFYAFFSDNEISIYRVDYTEADEFFALTDKYTSGELDFLEFMNQLTYLWPDYNEYEYNQNSMFISYPLKGIEIKLNYKNDLNGIYIYNNINYGRTKIEKVLENTDFVARLQLDSTFLAESRRVEKRDNRQTASEEYINSLEDEDAKEKIDQHRDYFLVPEIDNNKYIYAMKFYSRFGDVPDRELLDSIDSFVWGPNNLFIYSKTQKGIYIYNLENGTVSRLLTGEDEYKLKEYSDGKLKFDDTEIDF